MLSKNATHQRPPPCDHSRFRHFSCPFPSSLKNLTVLNEGEDIERYMTEPESLSEESLTGTKVMHIITFQALFYINRAL